MKIRACAVVITTSALFPYSISQSMAQVAVGASENEAVSVADPVIVTATRQEQRASEVLSRVEIIDRDVIERAGQSTLVELLRAQPGVQISNSGGPGSASSVFIRGAESRHTLLLVDGMRLGSATTGQPTLDAIPLGMIDRIEILRGPASALYGSEAIGGVIQIFTRKGETGVHPELFVGIGSNNTVNASAALAGGVNALQYSLMVGQDKTDGFNAKRDDAYWNQPWGNSYNPDLDGFRNRYVSASASLAFRSDDEIGLNLYRSEGRNWYDANDYADSYLDKTLSTYGIYMTNRLAEGWTSTLRAGRSEDNLRDYPDAFSPSRFDTTQTQFLWQNDIELPLGSLMAAYEYVKTEVESTTDYTVTSRNVKAFLLGWSAQINAQNIQINVRRDDNSQFGGKTTGLFSYGYQVSRQLTLQASIGTAFNAPTFNQLYWPDDGFGGGNPDLEPEYALSREVGLRWAAGSHALELTYYNNNVRDLIAGWPPENVNQANLQGVEIAYQTSLAGYDWQAGIDLLDAENEQTGYELPRRARKSGFVRADRSAGNWSWGFEVYGEGPRYDDTANRVTLAGYGLVDVYANYAFDADWWVEMRVNNALNKEYELSRGYASDGTNVFVGVRYSPR